VRNRKLPVQSHPTKVKGTSIGSVSNDDGTYSITVPAGSTTLVFSAVGMAQVEKAIGNATTIDVSLEPTGNTYDEVVVVGYTTSKKGDLVGAVSTLKVNETFKGRPATLGNMLQGQLPGVVVTNSGDPTSTGSIAIRGKGNKNGDAVLFVVDGVPNAPYNPADIYGALAGSGGVVLITTKQAKAGKMKVDVNGWGGFQQAWRTPKVLTSEQFNKVWADASAAAGRPLPNPTYDPIQFPYGNVTRTDWVDEIFQRGKMQHYDLTIRGGSGSMKALASVSYDEVEGAIITTKNKKLTSRLNLDVNLTKWLEVSQHTLFDFNNGRSGIGDGHTGVIFGAMAYPRFATVREYDADGNELYGGTVPRWALADGFSVEADLRNPVAMLEKVLQNNPSNRLFSKTSLRIKPLPGLQFRSEIANEISNSRGESFQMRFLEPGRTIDQNYRTISNSLNTSYNWDNILTYNKTFNSVHDLQVLAGFVVSNRERRYNWAEVKNYAIESPYQAIFNLGSDWSTRPTESIEQERLVSALGRLSYSFDNRYFVTASLRRDASSKLSPTDNSDIFPAVSASWKISSEKFMESLDEVSLLKLRASWGQVGSVASVRPFIYAPPYQTTGWPLFLGLNGGVQAFGLYQPTIPNPNLKWERTEMLNFGVDLALFNNALNITADYFVKTTKDLIESMPMPSVAGVASPPEFNIGQVENKGFEFTINYNKRVGQVNLNIGGNLGTYKNKVISIGETEFIQHVNGVNSMQPLRSTAGQPWHSFYLIQSAGIFRSQKEVDDYVWTDPVTGQTKKIQPDARPGDLKFIDENNDGTINDNDRVYMGAYDMPKFNYGINLGADWKGFTLSVFLQGVVGSKVFNGIKAMSYTGSKGWNMSTDVLNSYNYNPNSNIPNLAVVEDPNGNFSKVSDYFLEKADYMRVKNIHLAYTLPSSLISKASFLNGTTVRIYANAENAITITKYKGFDPEVGNLGIDGGRFPVSKMFSVGMNVSF
jgi:TonB-linked SusC/RagA family outer membrane protein